MHYAISAEKALLGTILKDNFYLNEANTRISHNDISSKNSLILEKINKIVKTGLVADKVSLLDSGIEELDEDYIDSLLSLSNEKNFESYLEAIEAEKLKRMIEYSYTDLKDSIRIEGMERNKIAELIQENHAKILDGVVRDSGTISNMRDGISEAIQKIKDNALKSDGITGMASGFNELDDLTLGFQPTDLIIVAARPAMGKTTFSYNIAEYACRHGNRGMFFSLEMPRDQIMFRSFSALGGIAQNKLKKGDLSELEMGKLSEATKIIDGFDLVIDEQGGLSVHELKLRARKEHAKKPLKFILVDYLQLLRAPEAGTNKNLEVTIISSELKGLAKELGIPVIVLSQLNRTLENRADKRPVNSDLRDSGSIEQDADIIIFLYRDEVYHEDSPDKGVAEVIIGKHRGGPLGVVKLKFEGQFSRFKNISHEIEHKKDEPLPSYGIASSEDTLLDNI